MTQPAGVGGPGEESQAHGPERGDYGTRAETYLRLLAEAELRRALACPRRPVERIPPVAVRWAANAVGAVSGSADLAAHSLGPAAARAGQGALRWLVPPARQVERALPPPVRRAGRAVARAGWQARIAADRLGDQVVDRLAGRAGPAGPTPQDSLERVHRIADVLVAAQVLSEPMATSVTHGFGRALAARDLLDEYYWPSWDMLHGQSPAAPAGPIVAAGINARVDLAADGCRASMHALALVLAPDQALVTTVSWLTQTPPGHEDQHHDWDNTLSDLVQNTKGQATDNRGGTYQLRMDSGGGSSDGPWEAQLTLTPPPPPGLDWLDITLAPGQDPVRVDLTAADTGEDRPGIPQRPASPAERAERIIDSVSERLLGRLDPEFGADERLAAIADLVRALRAAGSLTPDSPALARLLTLTRRQGQTVPAELADAAAGGPADLPAAWRATLEQGRWAGRAGRASAATAVAVLPELDGARCVIAGLLTETDSDCTTMQVLGWGWPWPRAMFEDLWQPFSWWARDDGGRWYRGSEGGYGSSGDMAEFQIELSPPVHPEATTLEVTLIGMSGRVTATVPVTWARVP